MRKKYIKPNVEVIPLEAPVLLSASDPDGVKNEFSDSDALSRGTADLDDDY